MKIERVYSTEMQPIVEYSSLGSECRVRWDFKEAPDNMITYMEALFKMNKPTIEDIKKIITASINQEVDNEIYSGFVWNGYSVWLSTENQFNYKAAYDLAVQTGGSSLPVTFKFGSDDNPQYYKFNTVEELSDFYTKSVGYIQDVLQRGWARKDGFDFSKYQEELRALDDSEQR